MSRSLVRKLLVVCLLITASLTLVGLKCPPGADDAPDETITLEWWRVNFDDSGELDTLIAAFEEAY